MKFKAEEFSGAKLDERIAELADQNIFSPDMIFIDGLCFDEKTEDLLSNLKLISKRRSVPFWFTMQTHRGADPDNDEALKPFSDFADRVIETYMKRFLFGQHSVQGKLR